ncbi:MAG: endo-1,4-beta-xylanase [Clostridia bacterium]|nr:endo-1,4-beta-xylanase [Clostridia bacterium]
MDRYQHRKSTMKLTLTDGSGKAMSGRKVRLTLKNHEFKFGCNIFWLSDMLKSGIAPQRKEKLEKMWNSWSALFNFGTLPFYQGTYEPREGETKQEEILRAAKFLSEHGVQLKGHPLCWHTVAAKWLMEKTVDEVFENQIARITREVTAFKDYVTMWDVINEVVIMPIFTAEKNAITPLCQKMGRVGLIKALFEHAHNVDPNATLLLNDFNTSEKYRELISDCLDAGVDINVIGIQSHQHQGFWGLDKLNEVLERFESFKKPIHFTENTFVSGDLMPPHIVDLNDWKVPEWPTTPEGEDRQARDFMAMIDELFAHPLVEAFTNWDFCDGAWLGAPAGLVRLDGSHKPSYDAMMQRIKRDWHTDVTLVADENGEVELTGFRGEYEAECDGKHVKFILDKAAEDKKIIFA